MLDSETKRRIDTARDILVGKVPDPKSQVEQITIALIYKFMDDMDAEAEEMGGKRSFFVGEYEKFGWAKLLSPALGGYEMLSLYTEAVEKMTRNEGIPQLFRDIFKNAYLPYRDPETLKLFLKTINEFNYEHSEKLGDAFEYLLSVLGSQGDAGQFRTPRHIIDFMVKVVDPKKDDSILDPACGTAGFLIAAYKHVMASNAKDGKPGGSLTPEERKKLAENIRGYDISPDMVRLSLVNLYLHGFTTPNIFEYDTLTSEERWSEYADVILANPPFMSPKGGIRPHKRFSVQSNRSEVLFVDYMAEHLTISGRAAIIVPEGIIFQSAGAYKQLRKYLVESNYLWAVASLPGGMFNPYAGVKTSILFLDKSFAKKTDNILFVKIEKDGYDLGAQRRPLCNEMGDKPELCPHHSDLPEALKVLMEYKQTLKVSENFRILTVSKSKLAENDYNLSANRYREVIRIGKKTWPMVDLGDERYFSIESGGTPDSKNEKYWNGDIYWATLVDLPAGDHISIITDTQRKISQDGLKNSSAKLVPPDSIIVSSRATIGRVGINKVPLATNQGFKNLVIKERNSADTMFVALMVKRLVPEMEIKASGGTFKEISKTSFSTLRIPLPPLETQRQIVEEITAHQRIIDGAREVVAGWKPNLEIELAQNLPDGIDEWPNVKLDEICDSFKNGANFAREQVGKGVKFVNIKDVFAGRFVEIGSLDRIDITEKEIEKVKLKDGDIVFIRSSVKYEGVGYPALIRTNGETIVFCGFIIKCSPKPDLVLPKYLLDILQTEKMRARVVSLSNKANITNISQDSLKSLEITLPPLDIQRLIVARIERERHIVEGNRELIRLYEEKVKKVIERVWEE